MNKISFFLFLTVLFFSIQSTKAQKLIVDHHIVLMDEIFSVEAIGLAPNQPIIITAVMKDSSGRQWKSFAGFHADKSGKVNLATNAPVNGTYSGVNPMGLIESMDLPGRDFQRQRFLYSAYDSIPVQFYLESAGKILDSVVVTRKFMKDRIKVLRLDANGLEGTFFYDGNKKEMNPVIILGGSEGGISGEDIAAILASKGYAALALAYFGIDNLPSTIDEIPIEYFKKGIDWINSFNFVNKNGVVLIGTSKGSEAALLTASFYKDIKGVVAYVPSSVTWSCICNSPSHSSWSFSGKPIPFVAQAKDPAYNPPAGFAIKPAVNYLYRLNSTPDFQSVTIPVEKINGPVLLIAGKDDQLWPSNLMLEAIRDRLNKYKHPFKDQYLAYEHAGHLIGKIYLPSGSTLIAGGRIETGGTPTGNSTAQSDSWPKVLNFLQMVFAH